MPILERAPKPSEELSMARKYKLTTPMPYLLPPQLHIHPVVLLKMFLDTFGLEADVPKLEGGDVIQEAPWRRCEMGTA